MRHLIVCSWCEKVIGCKKDDGDRTECENCRDLSMECMDEKLPKTHTMCAECNKKMFDQMG